jgi:hypothetical protein
MTIKFKIQILKNRCIELPEEAMKLMDLKALDFVDLELSENGQLLILPSSRTDPEQGWYWSRYAQQNERFADSQIEENRIRFFDSLDEMFEIIRKKGALKGSEGLDIKVASKAELQGEKHKRFCGTGVFLSLISIVYLGWSSERVIRNSLSAFVKNPMDKRVRVGTIQGREDIQFIKMRDGARVTFAKIGDTICLRNIIND